MTGQIVGYKRVSSTSQSLDRQELPEVTGRIFEEKLTGAKRDRPALQEMLGYVRDGDEVHVHSIDRLARNLKDLEDIVSEIIGKGSSIKFIKEGLHFKPDQETDPFQKLMFQMLGSFAEFERSIIRSRQAEGIKKAKEDGKYEGRKATINPYVVFYLHRKGVKPDDIADMMEIGRASVFRVRKEQEANAHYFEDTSVGRLDFLLQCLEGGLTPEEMLDIEPESFNEGSDKGALAWQLDQIMIDPEDKLFIKRTLEKYPTNKELKSFIDELEESEKIANELYHMKGRVEFTAERIQWLMDNNKTLGEMCERTGLPESAITAIVADRTARPNRHIADIGGGFKAE